jgi:prepilin-type N-terminal cleavage/methylation domain-containing protein
LFKLSLCNIRGYSFIELLLALAILGIVVTPLLSLFATAYLSINSARVKSTATNLCRSQIEQLRALGYDQVSFFYSQNQNNPLIEPEPEGCSGYRRETAVSSITIPMAGNESDPPSLLRIDVTVTWNEKNRVQSETLSTYLGRR